MPTVETGLQPNHSEWMRLVATLSDEQSTQKVYAEFVRHLKEIFDRADRFTCAGFGRSFKTKAEFELWKKEKWDPIADDRCKLQVTRRKGSVYVHGDYGFALDDWSRSETTVAKDGPLIIVRVYTAGYGLGYLDDWLSRRGASVQVYVEGEEHDFRFVEDAVARIEAQAGKKRTGGVRAKNRHDRPV